MSAPQTHALMIGVTDYPAIIGQDAPGSADDAVAMAALVGRVGATPARTTLLTSPSREGSRLPTREAIVTALQELIVTLRADPTALGVVFYAGHGATRGGQLLLCPSDTTPSLEHTLSFREILGYVGDEPLPRLTFVLDCCFAGEAEPGEDGAPSALLRTLTPGADATGAARWRDDLAARVVVLSASGPTQSAYALSLRPDVDRPPATHGALTSGLAAVLQRWAPDAVAQVEPYPIAYGPLVRHLRLYCRALALPQAPEVAGPTGVEGWLVFRDRRGGLPPAVLPGREITGGTYDSYVGDIRDGMGTFVGFYVRKVGCLASVAFWKQGYTPSGSSYTVHHATSAICLNGPYTRGTWTQAEETASTPEYFDLLEGTAAQPALVGNVLAIAEGDTTYLVWLLLDPTLPSHFRIVPGTHANLAAADRGAARGFRSAPFRKPPYDGTPTYTIRQPHDAAEASGGVVVSAAGLTWCSQVTTAFSCDPTPIFLSPGTAMAMAHTAVDPVVV